MAVIDPPLYLQSDAHPARSFRAVITEMYDEGVIDLTAFRVTQRAGGGPNFSVDVSPGRAVVQGDSTALQGSYMVTNDAVVTNDASTAVTSAPTAGNHRYDLVVLEVKDNAEDAGGLNLPRLRVVAGTPSSTGAGLPAVPATPITSLVLARIAPTLNSTTTITDSLILDMRVIAGRRCTPGTLEIHAGIAVPNGWISCDGTAISRTTFARLFAHIGTSYGPGNGSTTFNLPNLTGRMPWPRYAGVATQDTLGETGGLHVVTLTTATMPSHAHGGATGWQSVNHTHNVDPATVNIYDDLGRQISVGNSIDPGAALYRGIGLNTGGSALQANVAYTTTDGASVDHNHSITAEGGGAAHENMPPYTVVAPYIIRT